MKIITLKQHIESKKISQAEFARQQFVASSQVSLWVKKGYMISDGVMYSGIRKLI